jgi:hypothetical protein
MAAIGAAMGPASPPFRQQANKAEKHTIAQKNIPDARRAGMEKRLNNGLLPDEGLGGWGDVRRAL